MTLPTHITIRVPQTLSNRVTVIKSIRNLTGLGLKEAKDLQDQHGILHQVQTNLGISDREFEDHCRILRNEGCEVNGSVHQILQELRELGAQALKQGEDDLANEIMQLVLAEKLRRNNQGMV